MKKMIRYFCLLCAVLILRCSPPEVTKESPKGKILKIFPLCEGDYTNYRNLELDYYVLNGQVYGTMNTTKKLELFDLKMSLGASKTIIYDDSSYFEGYTYEVELHDVKKFNESDSIFSFVITQVCDSPSSEKLKELYQYSKENGIIGYRYGFMSADSGIIQRTKMSYFKTEGLFDENMFNYNYWEKVRLL